MELYHNKKTGQSIIVIGENKQYPSMFDIAIPYPMGQYLYVLTNKETFLREYEKG